MDRQTFARCIEPATTYYGRDLDREVVEIYFGELGGYTERQLDSAVRAHIANSKYFPKIPDLRKWITGKEERESKKADVYHPEYMRHREAAERMFEALLNGNEYQTDQTFLFPIAPIAEAAVKVFEDYEGKESAMSHAYSAIHLWTLNKLS